MLRFYQTRYVEKILFIRNWCLIHIKLIDTHSLICISSYKLILPSQLYPSTFVVYMSCKSLLSRNRSSFFADSVLLLCCIHLNYILSVSWFVMMEIFGFNLEPEFNSKMDSFSSVKSLYDVDVESNELNDIWDNDLATVSHIDFFFFFIIGARLFFAKFLVIWRNNMWNFTSYFSKYNCHMLGFFLIQNIHAHI